MKSRLLAGAALTTLLTAAGILTVGGNDQNESAFSPEAALAQSPTTSSTLATRVAIARADLEDLLPEETTTTSTTAPTTTTSSTSATTETTSTSTSKSTSGSTTTAPPTTAPATNPGGFNSAHEKSFTTMINSHRGGSGLGQLTRNSALDAEARAWSQHMATQGDLSHSNLSRLLPPWSSVGENVAVGGSAKAIFAGLVASGPHEENILGDFTHLGVGVWVDAQGSLWTTHIFAR